MLSATASCVALDCCSRRNSTSSIRGVVGNCSVHCSTSSIHGVVPPDLTSMDGGNAARLPGAVATSQSSPSYAV
ncbi:MAG: hypothetical protein ACXV8P_06340, partial [Methylobacter sp.]